MSGAIPIPSRYDALRRQVADAADAVGRDPEGVTVVAVSKTVGPEEISRAIGAGVTDFGENRIQEFVGKHALFPSARWHFVGTLQTNKVKEAVGRACLIHSVDTERLLTEIDRRAEAISCVQAVLLQVNVSGEGTKHGFSPDEVQSALELASTLSNVQVRGLMTMAPLAKPDHARPIFRELKELRDSLREMPFNGVQLDELSMGMTNDFCVAIEEGSTIVRVGRALFGR
ncbi:MAG: YggS family pyridoxal phosphate-dependent enzyme [Coriobacteriia bacterium]|nr:YggS family pyridoxal phosphate-dependent enzyme [Coriobacteriia bacterium]